MLLRPVIWAPAEAAAQQRTTHGASEEGAACVRSETHCDVGNNTGSNSSSSGGGASPSYCCCYCTEMEVEMGERKEGETCTP